jgi:hypothetical protein
MLSIETAELLNTETTAKRLKVSTRRVLQLVDRGELASIVVRGQKIQNIFTAEAVAALAERRKASPWRLRRRAARKVRMK